MQPGFLNGNGKVFVNREGQERGQRRAGKKAKRGGAQNHEPPSDQLELLVCLFVLYRIEELNLTLGVNLGAAASSSVRQHTHA